MKWLAALAVLFFSSAVNAAITYDSTACPTGIGSCPYVAATAGAALTLTATTASFSTGGNTTAGYPELIIIIGSAVSSGSALAVGTPVFSSGTFPLAINGHSECVANVCAYSAAVYASGSLSGVTVSQTYTVSTGTVIDVSINVFPVSSKAIAYGGSYADTGTTGLVGTIRIPGSAVLLGAFADGKLGTTRTGLSGSLINQTLDATTPSAMYTMSGITTAGSYNNNTNLGASTPALTTLNWAGDVISVLDATLYVAYDPAPGLLRNTSSGYSGQSKTGTTALTETTGPLTTIYSNEVVCAHVSMVGTGLTTGMIAITDSGITKGIGWTQVGSSCFTNTTGITELWCATTTAKVAAKAVTATIAPAASPTNFGMTILAFLYASSAFPTNTACNAGTSSAATVTVSNLKAGSFVQTEFNYTIASIGPTLVDTNTNLWRLWNAQQGNSYATTSAVIPQYQWATVALTSTPVATSAPATTWSAFGWEMPLVAGGVACQSRSLLGVGCDASPPIDLAHYNPLALLRGPSPEF